MTALDVRLPGWTIVSRTVGRLFGFVRPTGRTWAFIGVIYVLMIAAYAVAVRPYLDWAVPSRFPWPLLAVCFAIAELKGVDVHFRNDRHSFSLSEVPGVIGLFVLSPGDYLLAVATGTGVALLLESRQDRIRRSFNFGNFLLVGVVTLGIFHGLGAGRTVATTILPTPFEWIVAMVATMTASVVGTVLVAVVIALSGRAPQLQRLVPMIQFGLMVALANTSLALLAVPALSTEPGALLLLMVPLVTVYFAYRAYVSEHVKHERLELLYESSRILQHSPELDASILAIVEHARKMFHAELSRIIIFPDHAAGQALTTTSVQDGPSGRMVPSRPDREPELWQRVRTERQTIFIEPEPGEAICGRPLRQVMVSPLVGESGPLGLLLVANRIAEGAEFANDDLRLLETVSNQVGIAIENGQLERSLTELSSLKEELRHQAFHDALTGLPNRALFAEQVGLRLRGRSEGQEIVVLFLDLDDFKVVNDTLGHGVGDRLLVAVAERIRDCVRPTDLAARLGGDEFAVLLPPEDGLVGALTIGDRLVAALRTPFSIDHVEINVGASVGIASASPGIQDGDELLRNADVAMYTAKATGKSCVAVFDPLLHAELVARHELSAELSRSFGRGELLVYYQPIIELVTGRITGVEALVRWRHPTRGIVPPDEFIHLAEENGSIHGLGAFVLAEACRQTAEWRRDMDPAAPFSVSVNVSPLQLQQASFVDSVQSTLAGSGLDPHHLILEMTETGMLQDTALTVSRLTALQGLGVRVAMDDFGTGYSSLSYLRRFPIDTLKIARDFIAVDDGPDNASTEEHWAFARAIVALGRSLHLTIVAEGIEQTGQLHRLIELGCELGQGYHFARPAPPDETRLALIAAGLIPADPTSAAVLPAGLIPARPRSCRIGSAAPRPPDPAGVFDRCS